MSLYWDIIQNIYKKDRVPLELTEFVNFQALTRYLAKDKDNLPIVRKILPYLWYLSPETYYRILYLLIPRKSILPYLARKKEAILEASPLLDKVKTILGYSNKEFNCYKPLLNKVLDKKYWSKQLAIQ
jgi:hypothetical protein